MPLALRRMAVSLAACVLLFLTIWTACARLLEEADPALGAAVFPASAEAHLNRAMQALPEAAGDELLELKEATRRALFYEAGDARLYSLLGEIELRLGNEEEAHALFDAALRLSKTELNALRRTIARNIERDELGQAVGRIDVLLRRWPDRYESIAPAFPALLSTASGYEAVLAALQAAPPWRGAVLRTLSQDGSSLPLADRVLGDLAAGPAPPAAGEIATVISGYIRSRQYENAYRMFLVSLSPEEQGLAGYVFNGGFRPVELRRPFDWQAGRQSGADVSFTGREDAQDPGAGAVVRFLNKPVKGAVLSQNLQLPPGGYTLQATLAARSLQTPKTLKWTLRCHGVRNAAAEIAFPEGTYSGQELAAQFTIPPQECTMQTLTLETELIAQSWRHTYSGTAITNTITIGAAGS